MYSVQSQMESINMVKYSFSFELYGKLDMFFESKDIMFNDLGKLIQPYSAIILRAYGACNYRASLKKCPSDSWVHCEISTLRKRYLILIMINLHQELSTCKVASPNVKH